jgi:hypothetical protein
MTDKDVVWQHGDNLAPGFRCNYCNKSKRGGGATRLKEHLAGRGSNVVHCDRVPPDVRDYFRRELDRAKDKRKGKADERLRRQESARVQVDLTSDNEDTEEEQVQRAMAQSRDEEEFRRRAGESYEHGGGSGSDRGGSVLKRMLRRASSTREPPPSVRDYNVALAKSPVQPRIDTGSWSAKGKKAKEAIGVAWSKFFHTSGIPGRRADDAFFIAAVKETQKWGE